MWEQKFEVEGLKIQIRHLTAHVQLAVQSHGMITYTMLPAPVARWLSAAPFRVNSFGPVGWSWMQVREAGYLTDQGPSSLWLPVEAWYEIARRLGADAGTSAPDTPPSPQPPRSGMASALGVA